METYKELVDSLSGELVSLCRQKKDKGDALKKAEELLMTGADVNHKGSRPMYFAVKSYNFAMIRLLITFGALGSELSRRYLASLCERGGFTRERERAFFEVIDLAVKRTGFYLEYLAPYINMTLLMGRIDKLSRAIEKYGLSMAQAMGAVNEMVIHEVRELEQGESLNLIRAYLGR